MQEPCEPHPAWGPTLGTEWFQVPWGPCRMRSGCSILVFSPFRDASLGGVIAQAHLADRNLSHVVTSHCSQICVLQGQWLPTSHSPAGQIVPHKEQLWFGGEISMWDDSVEWRQSTAQPRLTASLCMLQAFAMRQHPVQTPACELYFMFRPIHLLHEALTQSLKSAFISTWLPSFNFLDLGLHLTYQFQLFSVALWGTEWENILSQQGA